MQSHTEWLEDIETRASEAMDKPRNRTELEITLAANLGVRIDAETVAFFDACIVNAQRSSTLRPAIKGQIQQKANVTAVDVTIQLREDNPDDPEQSLWLFTPNTRLGTEALLRGFPGAEGPSIIVVGIAQTNRIIQALRGYGLVIAYSNEEGNRVA